MTRKMISGMVLAMLVISLFALAVQTRSVKAEWTTLLGTVLYNEKPVSQFTSKAAVLWVRNESSGESFPAAPAYDTSTGKYSIPDIPPGEYGISVFIDAASPFGGESGFAGDFDGWNSPISIPEGQPIFNRNLTVVKTLHLTSPVDNAAVIGPWSYPEDTYPTEEMMFMWDALAEASSYHVSIEEYEEPNTYVRLATSNVTSDVKWNLTLPMSAENHFYMFQLYAYNINDVMVGKLMIPYSAGYGWDYRFRLAHEVIVANPTFSPVAGTYSSSQSVVISCSTSDATIRYTLDGSEPTSSSATYSSPIVISATTTIKAKAFKSSMADSDTVTATYTISQQEGVPAGIIPSEAFYAAAIIGITTIVAITLVLLKKQKRRRETKNTQHFPELLR